MTERDAAGRAAPRAAPGEGAHRARRHRRSAPAPARQGRQGRQRRPQRDLYLDISLKPHRLYRAVEHDLYLDLPLAPWEAALGAAVEVPTLAGNVNLKVPAGTSSGQKLRLAGRGLPRPRGGAGDLFAVAQIAVPATLSDRERELYAELARTGSPPRRNFAEGA